MLAEALRLARLPFTHSSSPPASLGLQEAEHPACPPRHLSCIPAPGRVPLAVMGAGSGAPPRASLPPATLLQNPHPNTCTFKRPKLRAATFTYQQTGTQGPLLLQNPAYEIQMGGLHPFLEAPRNIFVSFPS